MAREQIGAAVTTVLSPDSMSSQITDLLPFVSFTVDHVEVRRVQPVCQGHSASEWSSTDASLSVCDTRSSTCLGPAPRSGQTGCFQFH